MGEVGDIALVILSGTVLLWTCLWLRDARRARRAAERQVTLLVRGSLEKHFPGTPLEGLVVVRRSFPAHFRADLQRSLDRVVAARGAVRAFHGVRSNHGNVGDFASLLGNESWGPSLGPAEHVEVDVGDEEPVRCVRRGLWLVEEEGVRFAVYVSPAERFSEDQGVLVEIATPAGDAAATIPSRLFDALEEGIRKAASYRGKVLSLESSPNYGGYATGIRVHRLTPVDRGDLILPERVMTLLERNAIRFAADRDRLAALGQRLFKGILLYGPPGTGKTFSVHWLARALPDHTFLLVTAEQVGLFSHYMALARMLQPSVVVVEDADLIARERSMRGDLCPESALNGLLNELDGLREDARVLVILTTNRPDLLEPALAGRPGRVDQAIEIPLPDASCRRRLIDHYGRGLDLEEGVQEEIVRRTDRASAAFLKELLRKMIQRALEDRGEEAGPGRAPPRLSLRDLDAALDELLVHGGRLNAALLGLAPGE